MAAHFNQHGRMPYPLDGGLPEIDIPLLLHDGTHDDCGVMTAARSSAKPSAPKRDDFNTRSPSLYGGTAMCS